MSRSSRRYITRVTTGLLLTSFFTQSLTAQSQAALNAEDIIANADAAYGPPAPKPACKPQQGGEIVVCAEEQEQSQFRIRDDARAEDDFARETMNEGNPQGPDVAGSGIFRGKATVSGCVKGVTCPPPRAIDVDFAALPRAPEGSDADRIARGLPPLGQDGSAAPPPAPEGPR